MQYPLDRIITPTRRLTNGHTGIDFPVIKQPVYAIEDMQILFAGVDRGRGVKGQGKSGLWHYWHFDSLNVKTGSNLIAGQFIGISGGQPPLPGEATTGYHVHIDLFAAGRYIDWLAVWENEMATNAELEKQVKELQGWLKDTGNVARDGLKQMKFPNPGSLNDTDAVKVLRDKGIEYYKNTTSTYLPVGELFVRK